MKRERHVSELYALELPRYDLRKRRPHINSNFWFYLIRTCANSKIHSAGDAPPHSILTSFSNLEVHLLEELILQKRISDSPPSRLCVLPGFVKINVVTGFQKAISTNTAPRPWILIGK
jgi:hypothetical protein